MTLRERTKADNGFAMISVMLFGVAMLGLLIFTVSQVQQATSQSTDHIAFEREIHLAESGIDQALARLQKDGTWSTTSVPHVVTTPADEDAWVLARLDDPSAYELHSVDTGEYAIVKPTGRNVVYAASWAPSRALAKRTRVVKAEYLFSSYSPSNAVLSNGTLKIGGSASVLGSLGNVHANGNIEVVGGALTVEGTLTATGTVTNGQAGWVGGQAPQEVPEVTPRSVYDKFALDGDFSEYWYDLCPDGSVRLPSASGPCTGVVESSSGKFKGWELTNAGWRNDREPYDGVFYIYQGSAKITGTQTVWEATIIAEPAGVDGSLVDGDIEMNGKPLLHGFLPDIALIAGRDLDIQGTGNGDGEYEGLLGAHEQFKITGNPTLTGAVIGELETDTPGSPVSENYVSGSMMITHNTGLEADLGGLIRTTLWLEL